MELSEYTIYQKCIEASAACAVACLRCAKEIKKEQKSVVMEALVEMLFACAAVSLLNLKSLASESEFLQEACNKCEELCAECELACEKLAHLEYFKITALACGNCAMECKLITEM